MTYEMRIDGRQASLPPGLHPTNPPTFVVQLWRCGESPWGPFGLAQARIGSRSGLRPRGFVQGCVCDNDAAADALRRRWGFPVQRGSVVLRRQYDATYGAVTIGDVQVYEIHAPRPGSSRTRRRVLLDRGDPRHTPRGLRLVQVDIDVTVQRAERYKPRLLHFDGPRWGVHPSVVPYHPVSASTADGEITIQRLRYVNKPDELAFTSTEVLSHGRALLLGDHLVGVAVQHVERFFGAALRRVDRTPVDAQLGFRVQRFEMLLRVEVAVLRHAAVGCT